MLEQGKQIIVETLQAIFPSMRSHDYSQFLKCNTTYSLFRKLSHTEKDLNTINVPIV